MDLNGFKFSQTKTVCVHFCRLRKTHPDPHLLLNGTPTPVVDQTKFLGLIFDKKLSFVPHLQYLRKKCMKALNLLRVVAHSRWGSDENTLLHLYSSLIRSKLDYGAVEPVVYGSARKSYLRMLEPVQNQALRLCLGAFRTSQATSLHIEANEMPLDLRRRKLASQYCLKVSSTVTNPARCCIFNKQFVKFFDKSPNPIRPLGFRVSGDLSDIGFVQKCIQLSSLSSAPPWLLSLPSVDFSLTVLSKSDTNPEIFQSKFLEVCEGLQDHYHIYTDGSRMNSLVGAAAVGLQDITDYRQSQHFHSRTRRPELGT